MSATASSADAGRDLSRPCFVEHGVADESAGDDGRRIASFAGTVEVPAHGEASMALTLGQVADLDSRRAIGRALRVAGGGQGRRSRRPSGIWADTLGELRVETNQPAFDRLVNDWLPYQLLTARLWGRCGPNQRGGAFGFRDQLQDVLPLFAIAARPRPPADPAARPPAVPRGRRAAVVAPGRQPAGPASAPATAPRIRISGCPIVTARYVAQTGDRAILDERTPFLEGPPIPAGRGGHQLRAAALARGGIALRALPSGDRLHA